MVDRKTMDSAAIRAEVEARYPGARLYSVVQGCAYLEEFEKGLAAYQALETPSPEDDRWLGVCHFQLFDDERAEEAFQRAVSRGLDAARVNLSHLLRVTDRTSLAADEMRKVDLARLDDYDKVFFLRVRSIHEETNGHLVEALRYAEEAWRMLQGQPEFELLAPSILTQLGILHGRIGRTQRALWFLERAIELTDGVPQMKARLRWATVMVAQGHLKEASDAINLVDSASLPGPLQAEISWLNGEIAWARSSRAQALAHYEMAIEHAQVHGATYEEFLSRLAIATIHAFDVENRQRASEQLQRAQELISDRADRLAYRFREILVFLNQGIYGPVHALRELTETAEEFGDMSLLQEQAHVRLHIVSLKHRLAYEDFQEDLDSLTAIGKSLQNPWFLERELMFVPQLRAEVPLPR